MSAPLSVRPATAADVPALVALVNSAFRGDSSRAGWTTEADMLDGIRVDAQRLYDALANANQIILVHEDGDAIVACVSLERTGSAGYLGMLTTKPTLQGKGLGRAMVQFAERWVVDTWHSREMHMTVIVQRPELVAWYERQGYARRGERKPFPYGDERWGIPQRPDLEFVVLRKGLT
jgi:ribosomal protein S18 acetylase RimI-like enzyme